MRIGIQTSGSDGDIVPFFALASGLRTAGHDVTVCYTSVDRTDYSGLADKFDVTPINVPPAATHDVRIMGGEIVKTSNVLRQCLVVCEQFLEPVQEEMYEASQHLCRTNDIVIGHFSQNSLYTAAEKYRIPRVSICFLPPAIPSGYYPPLGSPDLGSLMNSLQHVLADKIGARLVFPSLNVLQSREGLPPVKRYSRQVTLSKYLTLVCVSPALFPPKPDWDAAIQVCGFFDLPADKNIWGMPPRLLEFIRAGSPPIYMTFGSMDYYQPEKNLRLLVDAIKLSKQRAIIQTTIDRVSCPINDPQVCIVNKVSHRDVFPLCAAVVHHGGVGVTQSSLLAGVPAVVIEHGFDQTFWARQLCKVGVTEQVLHRRSVTPRILADAMTTIVSSPRYNEKAKRLSAMMKKEHGVSTAVELIEHTFQQGSPYV